MSAHHLVTGRRVQNAHVFGADGHKLGSIDDLLIDKLSGKIAYALMRFDGFLGAGQRYYPIPWAMLDYDTAKDGFSTSLTHAQVDAGHHVTDSEVEDEIEWRERVHTYYAVPPYWF